MERVEFGGNFQGLFLREEDIIILLKIKKHGFGLDDNLIVMLGNLYADRRKHLS